MVTFNKDALEYIIRYVEHSKKHHEEYLKRYPNQSEFDQGYSTGIINCYIDLLDYIKENLK